MKFFLFCFIFIVSFSAKGFEYKLDEKALLSPSILNAKEIHSQFGLTYFQSLSDTALVHAGQPFDHVFVDFSWNQTVLLKAGLAVPKEKEGIVLFDEELDLYVFHFRFNDTPYMLIGLEFNEKEFRRLVGAWIKKKKVQHTSWVDFFIPKAMAQDCREHQELSVHLPGLDQSAGQLTQGHLLSQIGRCGMDALKGAGSHIEGTMNFFKKLVTNPRQLWSETKEGFMAMKNFVMDIKTQMQEGLHAFGDLGFEQKMELACTLAGGITSAAVQSLVVGPAVFARLAPKLLSSLPRATQKISLLMQLERSGVDLPNKKSLYSEVIHCAQ